LNSPITVTLPLPPHQLPMKASPGPSPRFEFHHNKPRWDLEYIWRKLFLTMNIEKT
jgi:hypothetical protein